MKRKEALREAVKHWQWIADETRKQKRIVVKYEYFLYKLRISIPYAGCFLCLYTKEVNGSCANCPSQTWQLGGKSMYKYRVSIYEMAQYNKVGKSRRGYGALARSSKGSRRVSCLFRKRIRNVGEG